MEKQLKSIKFPGLDDVYVIPETDISNKADNIQVKTMLQSLQIPILP